MLRTNKYLKIGALSLLASSMGISSQTSSVLAHSLLKVATEYKNSASGADFKNYDDDQVVSGLFQNWLSSNGLPMVSDLGKTYGGPSGPITQYDQVTQEAYWWENEVGPLNTPLTKVTVAGIEGLGISFPKNFYPTGSNNDSTEMAAAHWQIDLDIHNLNKNHLIFAMHADDDALAYVDGELFIDDGGTHAMSVPAAIGQKDLSVGEHTLDIFFADRYPVQAGIEFSYVVTPEPINCVGAFLALGLGAFVKKKTNSKIR